MVEQVPKQTFDQECKTEYTEECSHPKASLYGSASDPNYSSQPKASGYGSATDQIYSLLVM